MRLATLLSLLVLVGGCTRYEYSLLEPAEARQVISEKTQGLAAIAPLEYRLRVDEDSLTMRIANPLDETVYLLGNQSYVVDTGGESHSLPGRTIAPHSFATVQIPPQAPVYRVDYPVGYYGDWGYGYRPYGFYGPYWGPSYSPAGPAYITLDEPTPYYWEWPGPGEFRVHLSYRRDHEPFHQDMLFLRRKR